eukprot:TRINITY_DN806_c0_g1_i1.p1 TRINITY_DN806_c0_g1~~TRINITY_DN806_c0_g1_i1.p1  ORF type:complete len:228 (-),score=43.04 TRINITY_DN806_c0_g1_i1:101-784(-)
MIKILLVFALFTSVLASYKPDPTQTCTSDQWISDFQQLTWANGFDRFYEYLGTIYFNRDLLMTRVDVSLIDDGGANPGNNLTTILDFNNQVEYFIFPELDQCFVAKMSSDTDDISCLPDSAVYSGSAKILGSVTVDSWYIQPVTSEDPFTELTLSRGNNVFVSQEILYFTSGNVTSYNAQHFFNWIDGSVSAEYFTIPSECNSTDINIFKRDSGIKGLPHFNFNKWF